MAPLNGPVDLSDIDLSRTKNKPNNTSFTSLKDDVYSFLDRDLSDEKIGLLLSDEYKSRLIEQLIDLYKTSFVNILSFGDNSKLDEMRGNIADFISVLKLLKDSSTIKKESFKTKLRNEQLSSEIRGLKQKNEKLELQNKRDSKTYEEFKTGYESTITTLISQIEELEKINSELIEEDVSSKINNKNLISNLKKRLITKKVIGSKEFLDSSIGKKILDEEVLKQTQADKETINILNGKIEKISKKVIDLEDTNGSLKISNTYLKSEVDDFKKEIEKLPTHEEVNKLKQENARLIKEKSDAIQLLFGQQKTIDGVGDYANELKKKMQEMEDSIAKMKEQHQLEIDKKDEEIKSIKASKVANNYFINPSASHVIKTYDENK